MLPSRLERKHSTMLAPSAPMTPPAPHGPPTSVASNVSAIRLIVEAMSTTNASARARWVSRAMSGTGVPASGSVSFPTGFFMGQHHLSQKRLPSLEKFLSAYLP